MIRRYKTIISQLALVIGFSIFYYNQFNMSNQYERYGDYIINRKQTLGSGKFGTVWRGYKIMHGAESSCQDYSLQPVAIKESRYDQQNIQQINTLQILNHPNIIKYIDYKISGQNLFMVMELCQGGTLEDLLLSFPEGEVMSSLIIQYYSQIVRGIKFMYEKNILHRDIKPSNILIKDNNIKIADFGTSKQKHENQIIRTLVGTPLFASPQILQLFVGDQQSYTEKSDIWSLGLILYFMFHYQRGYDTPVQRLKQSLPWKGKNPIEVLHNIKTKPLQFKNQGMPSEIKQILKHMLTINVEQRMSFKQFFEIELFNFDSKLKPKIKGVDMLMNNSLVDLQLSQSMMLNDLDEYELTLINQCTHQPKLLKKETINFQLLKLLQMKDCEDYEDKQISSALKYFQIIRDQAQNSQSNDNLNDLLFEIDCHIYQLCMLKRFFANSLMFSRKGIAKSQHQNTKHQMLSIFDDNEEEQTNEGDLHLLNRCKIIVEKYFAFGKRFETVRDNLRKSCEIFLNNENILQKQKNLNKLIFPNEQLLEEVKLILKRKRIIFEDKSIKKNAIMSRNEIYLVYDLINVVAFQFCWKIRAQQQKNNQRNIDFFDNYKEERSTINIVQIINRIQSSLKMLKF